MKKEYMEKISDLIYKINSDKKIMDIKLPRYSIDRNIKKEIAFEKKDLKEIYRSCILMNSFYSTQMGADYVYKVAQHIKSTHSKISKWVKKNEPEREIKEIKKFLSFHIRKKKGKKYHPYSFLTKYLTVWSRNNKGDNQSNFPIYDRYVHLVLKVPAKNYEKLYDTVKEIQKIIKERNNTKLSFKQIDYAAWLIGKFTQIKNQKDVKELLKKPQKAIDKIKKNLNKEQESNSF